MKAYLIDPVAREITAVEYSGDYLDIYALIDASTFDVVRLYRNGDGAFIDDEGLFRSNQSFWLHKNYPQPIAGAGLLLGVDEEGESIAPETDIETLRRDVVFMSAEQVQAWVRKNCA